MFKWLLVLSLLAFGQGYAGCGCKKPEQGPAGPPGACPVFGQLSVFLNSSSPVIVLPLQAIVFPSLAVPIQGTSISYNAGTGTVTFNTPGFYKVTYALSGSGSAGGDIAVALQISPPGVYPPSGAPFPANTALIPGSEVVSQTSTFDSDVMFLSSVIVQVTSAGQTMKLIAAQQTGNNLIIAVDPSNSMIITPTIAMLEINQLQ